MNILQVIAACLLLSFHLNPNAPGIKASRKSPQQATASKERVAPEAKAAQSGQQIPDRNSTKLAQGETSVKVVSVPPVAVSKDWMDYWVFLFTAILTLVGVLGTYAAIKTLRQIKRQADLMVEHRDNLKELAAAAGNNAEAALLNAKALINAERPWVMVQIKEIAGNNKAGIFASKPSFQFSVYNYGKSPAHILKCRGPNVEIYNSPDTTLPVPPNYGNWDWDMKFLAPGDSLPIREAIAPLTKMIEITADSSLPVKSSTDSDLVAYGLIEYTDGISKEPYRTAFCYRYERNSLSETIGGRFVLGGPSAYNEYD